MDILRVIPFKNKRNRGDIFLVFVELEGRSPLRKSYHFTPKHSFIHSVFSISLSLLPSRYRDLYHRGLSTKVLHEFGISCLNATYQSISVFI